VTGPLFSLMVVRFALVLHCAFSSDYLASPLAGARQSKLPLFGRASPGNGVASVAKMWVKVDAGSEEL
jgi:hypothetical protein